MRRSALTKLGVPIVGALLLGGVGFARSSHSGRVEDSTRRTDGQTVERQAGFAEQRSFPVRDSDAPLADGSNEGTALSVEPTAKSLLTLESLIALLEAKKQQDEEYGRLMDSAIDLFRADENSIPRLLEWLDGGTLTEDTVNVLFRGLSWANTDATQRALLSLVLHPRESTAREALAYLTHVNKPLPEAWESVRKACDDPRVEVRSAAATALGWIAGKDSTRSDETLALLLKLSEDRKLLVSAMSGLHLSKNPGALSRLADLARSDEDEKVFVYAVQCISDIEGEQAATILGELATSHRSENVRWQAVFHLARHTDSLHPTIKRALEADPSELVRGTALGRYVYWAEKGDLAAKEVLRQASLQNSFPSIRDLATMWWIKISEKTG